MKPLVFVWPYALAFWVVFVWAFAIESRVIGRALPQERKTPAEDAGSLWVVMLSNFLGSALAFVFAFTLPRFAMHGRVVVFWLGVVTIIGGSLLRRHCFRMLGEYFTGNVQTRRDQPVIDRGAYRLVRHPSYLAGTLMFTGVGLALGNWMSLLVGAGFTVLGYLYRIRVEERALLATLGEPYRAYMRRTKRVIPYIL